MTRSPKHRIERLAALIREGIAGTLSTQIKDPRIGFVTVTGVTVSADAAHATVRVSVLGTEEQKDSSMAALENARGFVRTQLARSLDLRTAPVLHFVLDRGLENASRIDAILEQIKHEEPGLLTDGLLLLDKPVGPTAHDAVAIVRRALQVRRAGHTGTLDPFASGLLVVLVGRATRLARYLVDLTKSYTGTIKLGESTDTCDLTGEIVGGTDGWKEISSDRIADAMHAMTGTVSQVPPSYSAKKIGGERAYRLARRGEMVELEPREVQVQRFEMLEREGAFVDFASEVSSGTYIRGLARDLGEILGCGAHLTALRRKSVGRFTVDDATLLDAVDAATELRPPLEAVSHLPIVKIDEELRNAVRCGRPIESSLDTGESVALVAGDTLVAVAQSEAELLKPRVVLEG